MGERLELEWEAKPYYVKRRAKKYKRYLLHVPKKIAEKGKKFKVVFIPLS